MFQPFFEWPSGVNGPNRSGRKNIFNILLTRNIEILRCRPLESLILVLKHTTRFGFWFFLWSSHFFSKKNERLGFTNSVIPKVDSHCGETTNEVGFNQTKHLDLIFEFGILRSRFKNGALKWNKNLDSSRNGSDNSEVTPYGHPHRHHKCHSHPHQRYQCQCQSRRGHHSGFTKACFNHESPKIAISSMNPPIRIAEFCLWILNHFPHFLTWAWNSTELVDRTNSSFRRLNIQIPDLSPVERPSPWENTFIYSKIFVLCSTSRINKKSRF